MTWRSEILGIIVLCFILQDFRLTHGLECWKCIQQDCHVDPSTNQRAEKVTCAAGEHCLKVRYQMFHNDSNTRYDSVIRTCSSYKCPQVTEKDYESCLGNMRKYMFQGCSLRSCCNDRDFCNTGTTPVSWSSATVIFPLILHSVILHCWLDLANENI
ncbi:uncharacterized protein LOC125665871 [Ostrea edulis]|uniref:uncharacterized protein LOC125665871 n=1 Tax=Ostrea edulis TaxID=37623 RepID=UPI002094EC3F|nr:uncharacterized protein LOC125665871 [Ostrea edulis]